MKAPSERELGSHSERKILYHFIHLSNRFYKHFTACP